MVRVVRESWYIVVYLRNELGPPFEARSEFLWTQQSILSLRRPIREEEAEDHATQRGAHRAVRPLQPRQGAPRHYLAVFDVEDPEGGDSDGRDKHETGSPERLLEKM